MLNSCADVLAPVIATLANLSLQLGNFSSYYKKAQMSPLLKNPRLESSLPVKYSPISNLPTVSKVLKRLVLTRLIPYLLGSANFSQFQSAYRKGHSTETALLDVLDSVYTAVNDSMTSRNQF